MTNYLITNAYKKNILTNNIEEDINSGNITSTMSEHYVLKFFSLKMLTPKKTCQGKTLNLS